MQSFDDTGVFTCNAARVARIWLVINTKDIYSRRGTVNVVITCVLVEIQDLKIIV